ncbi:MAG: hypothetical protein R2728_06710 [Chitinophagales bacterium]
MSAETALKYNSYTLNKVEDIFKASEYVIRYERGNFNSGFCILEDKKVIVINKFYDTEARINCLLEILNDVLILEDNLDEKELKFYNQLLSINLENKTKL